MACSHGTEVSVEAAQKLKQHGIPLRIEPVVALNGIDGDAYGGSSSKAVPICKGLVCSFQPVVIKRLIFRIVSVASATKKEGLLPTPPQRRPVCPECSLRVTYRAMFCLYRWPSRKVPKRQSRSMRPFCGAMDFAIEVIPTGVYFEIYLVRKFDLR